MDDVLLAKLIHNLSEVDDPNVIIIWHGGEPLLAGIDFYRKVVEETRQISEYSF